MFSVELRYTATSAFGKIQPVQFCHGNGQIMLDHAGSLVASFKS
jgi:hypothetical protein